MKNTSSENLLDKAGFEALFKAHFSHLVNFSKQYVQEAQVAKDITQKLFIHLWENRSKMDPNQNLVSYLFTAVKNRSLNYIRDNKKYRSKILDLDCGNFEIAPESDPFDAEVLKQRLEEALSELPEKCRLVFEMSRFKEMKYKEIAEELDIAQKTVEAHMSKAMRRLREKLSDYQYLLVLIHGFWP